MHPYDERLYAQCGNDTFIHCIEITSGIIIQSYGEIYSATSPHAMQKHKKFTVSACGSLVFNAQNAKILCWNYLNEQKCGELHIPPTSVESNTFISTMDYHPNLLLMVSSIYGENNNTSICLMSYENDDNKSLHDINITSDYNVENELEQDLLALERWHRIRQNVLENDEKAINTFDKIIDRIDNLFNIAIKKPNHTDDYKQQIQCKVDKVKSTLEATNEFTLSPELSATLNESTHVIENVSQLNEDSTNTTEKSKETPNANNEMYELTSNSSVTYVIEENTNDNIGKEYANVNLSNSSNTSSNRTFKITTVKEKRNNDTYEIEIDTKIPHPSDTSISDSILSVKSK